MGELGRFMHFLFRCRILRIFVFLKSKERRIHKWVKHLFRALPRC